MNAIGRHISPHTAPANEEAFAYLSRPLSLPTRPRALGRVKTRQEPCPDLFTHGRHLTGIVPSCVGESGPIGLIMGPMDQESLVMDALDLANRPTPHDVASLESYLAALKTHADGVLALGDGMDGETWFRTHSTLVTSGLWRRLKPCSRSVYVVLSAAADRRKRCTIIGAVRVAERAGLSVPRVLFAYKELKDFGLIRRWRIKLGPYQPYLTVLTAPSRWSPAA